MDSKSRKRQFYRGPAQRRLSVYEPGQDDSTLAVVEIKHPRVDGADLVYSYKVVKGTLPASGGQTACSSMRSAPAAVSAQASTARGLELAVPASAAN